MKTRIFKTVISLLLVLCISVPAYANGNYDTSKSKVLNSYLQENVYNNVISKVTKAARGRLLSSCSLQISNDNDGIIGIYADTLCHSAMKQIYMTIYLDVWDDSIQDWRTVDSYEYSWKASDNPGRELTNVSVSFDVVGLRKGRTYSLRGNHSAVGFDSSSEVMMTETNGIVLD